MSTDEDQIEAQIWDLAVKHLRTLAKATLIGLMTLLVVLVSTGSGGKAIAIGFSCWTLSFFNTWRRFLEPVAFFLFCAAMVYWCDPDIWQRAKASITALCRAA